MKSKSECGDCLYNITFISSSGQIVKEYNSVRDEIEINKNDIGKGLYFVKIVDSKSENYLYKKVVIE